MLKHYILVGFVCSAFSLSAQEHSIARKWNEVLLESIRNDFARPTVHARNLFHSSALMYDVYAIFDPDVEPIFFGKEFDGNPIPFDSSAILTPSTIEERDSAITVIMSFAMARLIEHRFEFSPGYDEILMLIEDLFSSIELNPNFFSQDYSTGNLAALGNYMAARFIELARNDGSNERSNYRNTFYRPVNPPLNMQLRGNAGVVDPNRWQELSLSVFIDQSGNVVPGSTQPFLSAEWGRVLPFSLKEEDREILFRDDSPYEWWVYHNTGHPPYLTPNGDSTSNLFKETFLTCILWAAHLDPRDTTLWDISPGGLGNTPDSMLPREFKNYNSFYNLIEGGHKDLKHRVNPVTGMPYAPQFVKRADYARVLAEFWADGPDSETPPGHWFAIFNKVMDHPDFERKWYGEGEELSPLAYDVRAYLVLGGAMHDAAVSTWSIKGYYDYTRPVSAIRYMASKGQSTDTSLVNYHVHGLPLLPGYVEVIGPTDPLAGQRGERIGKIKIFTWRGPEFISDPSTDFAGVGWMLAEEWWPYQRPTFVTPPFAGYLSGHSTFSRTAAEVLTKITGSEFFPGGMGEFVLKKDEFLIHENGPSETITLQWATYKDASDQTSLSRIWGGIHPPVDDIFGRLNGIKIAKTALAKANEFFRFRSVPTVEFKQASEILSIYPNPVSSNGFLTIDYSAQNGPQRIDIFHSSGQRVYSSPFRDNDQVNISLQGYRPGLYIIQMTSNTKVVTGKLLVVE